MSGALDLERREDQQMKLLLTYSSNWTGGGVKLCALYRGYDRAKSLRPGDRVLCKTDLFGTTGGHIDVRFWSEHIIKTAGKYIEVVSVSYREGDGHYVKCDSEDCRGHWIWNIH